LSSSVFQLIVLIHVIVLNIKIKIVKLVKFHVNREIGFCGIDWIGLAKDRNRWRAVVNSVLNLQLPCNAGKLSSGLTSSGLSSSAQLHIIS
jgi:hypothetical protein